MCVCGGWGGECVIGGVSVGGACWGYVALLVQCEHKCYS